MLNSVALGNSLAGATVVLYLVLYILKLVSPPFFRLFLNSRFLGADIASQIPSFNLANFLGVLLSLAITSWLLAYITATIYNKSKTNSL